jgi:hypothetical protein
VDSGIFFVEQSPIGEISRITESTVEDLPATDWTIETSDDLAFTLRLHDALGPPPVAVGEEVLSERMLPTTSESRDRSFAMSVGGEPRVILVANGGFASGWSVGPSGGPRCGASTSGGLSWRTEPARVQTPDGNSLDLWPGEQVEQEGCALRIERSAVGTAIDPFSAMVYVGGEQWRQEAIILCPR